MPSNVFEILKGKRTDKFSYVLMNLLIMWKGRCIKKNRKIITYLA